MVTRECNGFPYQDPLYISIWMVLKECNGCPCQDPYLLSQEWSCLGPHVSVGEWSRKEADLWDPNEPPMLWLQAKTMCPFRQIATTQSGNEFYLNTHVVKAGANEQELCLSGYPSRPGMWWMSHIVCWLNKRQHDKTIRMICDIELCSLIYIWYVCKKTST